MRAGCGVCRVNKGCECALMREDLGDWGRCLSPASMPYLATLLELHDRLTCALRTLSVDSL